MKQTYWDERWNNQDIGFHESEGNHFLMKHAGLLHGPEVYVPLCGKAKDLLWLAQQGYRVTGSEWVESAARDFFAENHLETTETRLQAHLSLTATSLPIRVIVGDAFSFADATDLKLPAFDSIFDRAALVAIDPSRRREYVDVHSKLLKNGGTILAITFDYDQSKLEGPPWSVSQEQMNILFSSGFTLSALDSRNVDRGPKFRNAGIDLLEERATLLHKII